MPESLAAPADAVGAATAAPTLPVGAATAQPTEAVGEATAEEAKVEEDTPRVTAHLPNSTSSLSVQALRGRGSDFESYAAVLKGAPDKHFLKRCLPCMYDERDFVTFGEVRKFCLLKGSACFVFLADTDLEPLYALDLTEYKCVLEDVNHPDPASITISPTATNLPRSCMVTVLLKDRKTNEQAFQFTLDTSDDGSLAKRFMDVVQQAGKSRPVVTASVAKADGLGKDERLQKQQPKI